MPATCSKIYPLYNFYKNVTSSLVNTVELQRNAIRQFKKNTNTHNSKSENLQLNNQKITENINRNMGK